MHKALPILTSFCWHRHAIFLNWIYFNRYFQPGVCDWQYDSMYLFCPSPHTSRCSFCFYVCIISLLCPFAFSCHFCANDTHLFFPRFGAIVANPLFSLIYPLIVLLKWTTTKRDLSCWLPFSGSESRIST